ETTMIVTLDPEAPRSAVDAVEAQAARYPGVTTKLYEFVGAGATVREVHLIGSTRAVPTEPFQALAGVRAVNRVSVKYRLIGRHGKDSQTNAFEYNGVTFGGDQVQLIAGLCAVDTREHVDQMLAALAKEGIRTTRMGAYKPRTSPYDFQGLGKQCLPWVFESC